MSIKKDNVLILNAIKLHYDFKSNAEFAAYLGIAPQTLSSWYSRNSFDYDLIYSKCVGLSGDWLITGIGNMLRTDEPVMIAYKSAEGGIPLIPIDCIAGQGKGDFSVMSTDILDNYVVPEFKSRGVEFLIRVSGASMYPKYSNGDLLACKNVTDSAFFQWGKVYVLDTDQGAVVKRLFPCNDNGDCFECRSDNAENYPPFQLPKTSVRGVAIVVGVIRLE